MFTALDTAAPYSVALSSLPAGTNTLYARASNGVNPDAYTVTNTVIVLPVVSYTGGTIVENFNSMGTAGTNTPSGWYVSAIARVTNTTVTADDGSTSPNGTTILGWNYGASNDPDRALGTAPPGSNNDRYMAVAIQNNTGSNMTSIEVHFDGEVWRNYTNSAVVGALSTEVSINDGASWFSTDLVFTQPSPSFQPAGAVNGNTPTNRIADINGVIILPVPLPSGAVLFIRV